MRRLTVAVRGNPAMDVGDLVKMRALTSTANAKYMIIAIQSEFSENGYLDIVDLEYVDEITGHICEPAEGDYEMPDLPEGAGGDPVTMTLRDQIVDYAKTFLGTLYQWAGGRNVNDYGLDCSGFTAKVLMKFGLMPSVLDSRSQRNFYPAITRTQLKPGDLVFYTWGGSVVKHVVMYIGNGMIIGANGGNQGTTSPAKARMRNAMVKIQPIDYGPPVYFGRTVS